MSDVPQGNGRPKGKGGPKTEAGKRRVSLNSRKHGLFAVGSDVPPVSRCPLRASPRCDCDTTDPLAPCPRFDAYQRALEARFLRLAQIKTNPACWHLVRELVKGLLALEVADSWVWRTGWIRSHKGGLDVQPLERARGTRAAEVRRLSEILGLSVISSRGSGPGGGEPIDLASLLAQVAKREEGREP